MYFSPMEFFETFNICYRAHFSVLETVESIFVAIRLRFTSNFA